MARRWAAADRRCHICWLSLAKGLSSGGQAYWMTGRWSGAPRIDYW